MNRSRLLESWEHQRPNSWWQSILLIAVFFWLLLQINSFVIVQSHQELGLQNEPDDYMSLLAHNQWLALGLLFALIIGLLVLMKNLNFQLFTKNWLNKADLIVLVKTIATVFVVNTIFGMIVMTAFPDYEAPANQQTIEEMFGIFHWFYLFGTIVIAAPLYEEVLIRGLIMKYIFGSMPVLGALAASISFAMMHLPENIIDFMTYFIMSAGITFVYWQTRKIEYSILYHLLNNGFGYLLLLLLERFGDYLPTPV